MQSTWNIAGAQQREKGGPFPFPFSSEHNREGSVLKCMAETGSDDPDQQFRQKYIHFLRNILEESYIFLAFIKLFMSADCYEYTTKGKI